MQKLLAKLKRAVGKLIAVVGVCALTVGGVTTWLTFSKPARAQAESVLPAQVSAYVTPGGKSGLPTWAYPTMAAGGLACIVLGVKWARGGGKKKG